MSAPTLDTAKMKMGEIAERIGAHLKRFEANPEINKKAGGLSLYWNSRAYSSGPRVFVTYISYQGRSSLTKEQAAKYLEKLDGGFVGRHYSALKD